ncbi:MAG: copper-binding protein [Sandaracinus sp.]|nr:copper-binding protein [Sandaracinus sp.]
MKRLVLLLVLGLAACGQNAPAESAAAAEGPARYTTRGTIENLTPMRAEIAHEDVPGYMPAMTMPFFAKEEGQLTAFTVGDSGRVHLRSSRRWAPRDRLDLEALTSEAPRPRRRRVRPTLRRDDGHRSRARLATLLFRP